MNRHRVDKNSGNLEREKEMQLEELGVIWGISSQYWETMYTLLTQYKQKEGHCNVPQSHQDDGEKLGIWLKTQRREKKNGSLDAVKAKKLEELNIVWEVWSQQWEKMYTLLTQYKQQEGHCNVPKSHQEDGQNLGNWLHRQRLNKKNGKLDTMKEQKLEDLGVMWNPFSQKWEDMYALLVKYKQRKGHCNVPHSYQETGENIGTWWIRQRHLKKNGKLDAMKEQKLEDLGVVWDPYAQQWDDLYILLAQYKRREGHCNVPQSDQEDGRNLGAWLSTQRQDEKNGDLDVVKEQKLEELGVVWSTKKVKL